MLPSCLHGHSALVCASCRRTARRQTATNTSFSPPGLKGMRERADHRLHARARSRLQQRYDHRLRELVQHTGDVTPATEFGVPSSTARGWLGAPTMVVVRLDVAHLTEAELRPEILPLRRRVTKRAARLRLGLAVRRVGGFTVAHQRLPDGRAKQQILTAVDQARTRFPLRALLRILRLSPSRFHAWRRQDTCARRTVTLSAYIATSTDTSRSPAYRGHGDLA